MFNTINPAQGQGLYIMPNGGVMTFGAPNGQPPPKRRRRRGKGKKKEDKPTRWVKAKKKMGTFEGAFWLTLLSPFVMVAYFGIIQSISLLALFGMKLTIHNLEALAATLN